MGTRTYYCWKVWFTADDQERYLVDPWGDPFVYEHPFNFQFNTEDEARTCKTNDDFGPTAEEDWVLIKVTETVEFV